MQKTKQPSRIKRIPVTREGFENLKKEFEQLQKDRPQAVKNLAEARGMGDLSENGLYTAAKSRLRSIDSELFRLDIQIKLADIMEATSDNMVTIGSKVTVTTDKINKTFHIVGDYEANPTDLKISQHSPLGRALIGKKLGEIAEYSAPKGIISFKIISIS